MEIFIERLKELVYNDNNLTLEKLANEININSSTMSSWTSRYNMPKLDKMIDLSNYFKCSIEFLIGRSEDNSYVKPKDCPPFHIQLQKFLERKGLKINHLRNAGVISAGLNESIFKLHSIPFMDSVIKIADYFKISVDELVGRV